MTPASIVGTGTLPAADRVSIKKAEWKPGPGPNATLTIEANSTNPNAILSVYIGGGFAFELTNQGGGKYFDQRLFRQNPGRVEVRSNLGGSASART